MTENKNNTETIKKTSMRNLYQNGYFKTVGPLSINKSGFPFIVLLNKNNKAQSLYFSKNCSGLVLDHFKKGDSMVSFLSDADCIETTNEAGEIRFKIVKSGGKYETEASLEQAFGETTNSEFSYENFVLGYESNVAVQTT